MLDYIFYIFIIFNSKIRDMFHEFMIQIISCSDRQPFTDDLYEILSSLPESVVYSCQPCTREQPGAVQESEEGGGRWRELLQMELRAGVEKVLACLLSSTLTQHLVICKEVRVAYPENI